MNYFERVFQEFWPQIKKQILYRTYVLQNSHYTKLLQAACGTFLFSIFVCIWLLILHARIQSLKESWAEASHTSVLEKGVFKILEEPTWKHPRRIQLKIKWRNLANMHAGIKFKNCVRQLCVWRPGRHICAFCMLISRLFSSGIKLGVRKFRDLINVGLYCFLSVSSILLYFISIRSWVENLRIKTVLKILWL